MFAIKLSMEKQIIFFLAAWFSDLPAINATVFSNSTNNLASYFASKIFCDQYCLQCAKLLSNSMTWEKITVGFWNRTCFCLLQIEGFIERLRYSVLWCCAIELWFYASFRYASSFFTSLVKGSKFCRTVVWLCDCTYS